MGELISVIMGVYNEKEEWLTKSIESILQQTYKNFEFIIVLDKPDNKLAEKIIKYYQNKDKRILLLKNESNIGLVKSMNRALSFAKGKYIARMDADDISVSERLELQYNYIISENVDFVIGDVDFIYDNNEVQKGEKFPPLFYWQINELMKYGNISIHPSWFLKKEVYIMLGGYRLVNACEDYDFILRAIQEGVRCYRMKEHVLYYRIRNDGISKKNLFIQYISSQKLRYLYCGNVKISYISPDEINRIKGYKYKKIEESILDGDREMDIFCKNFKRKKYLKCILLAIRDNIVNAYFREVFWRNIKFRNMLNKITG